MDWAQILVIILATLFAIFLLMAILLAVLIIKVTKQLKSAAMSAERTVSLVEGAVMSMNKAALPLTVLRLIIKQVSKPNKKKAKGVSNEQG